MIITYAGHSCFKLKGKAGTVVTDPFNAYVGFAPSSLSADMVTVSHQHQDHNATKLVKGNARRKDPFVIDALGEYEVAGISVFGVHSFHDATQGVERGENFIYTILLDGLRICHLGDLGQELTETQIADIGMVDVLFVPVGGSLTLNPDLAVKTIRALEPSYAIPMHYNTPDHDQSVFGDLATVDDFIKKYGTEVKPVEQLSIEPDRLPEETEVVVLFRT